ncbi:MAG: hypothetical protein Q8Q42_03350 [Nanoarchaeota archaeon]|nr:hypothetical protein [Nanoarchaeota archaeon]
MALDVTFEITTGATTQYRLKCDTVAISYDRPVIRSPLAGNITPLILDIGGLNITITLEGRLDDTTPGNDGGIVIPGKVTLENAITNWWNETVQFTVLGDVYPVKVLTFRCTVVGAQETWWNYNMVLAAGKRTSS